MISVIIPDRNGQPYLQQTIDDLLRKAEGEIEIIVACDGTWPNPPLKNHPQVRIIHHGTVHNSPGMREGINKGVYLSKGEYIMKIDEHCMLDQGFDKKLITDCEDNWVVIPRRYRLMADNEPWRLEEYIIQENGLIIPDPSYSKIRPPVDYMYLAYPYERPFDKTCGLHGAEDKQRGQDRQDILIDDVMTCQGSCWFMSRKHWDSVIKEMDDESYGTFTQEAQEITMKTWLSGGRVVVNKKTWYSHMHKGSRGKGYGFSTEQYKQHMEGTEKGRLFCIDFWVNNKWTERVHDFKWLIEKFWPVLGWPEDWETKIKIDQANDYANSPNKKNWYQNNI